MISSWKSDNANTVVDQKLEYSSTTSSEESIEETLEEKPDSVKED